VKQPFDFSLVPPRKRPTTKDEDEEGWRKLLSPVVSKASRFTFPGAENPTDRRRTPNVERENWGQTLRKARDRSDVRVPQAGDRPMKSPPGLF
jgi:hypothetical protein